MIRIGQDVVRIYRTWSGGRSAALAALMIAAVPSFVLASPEADDVAALELRHAESSEEYERVRSQIELSTERRAELEEEIAAVRKDHAALSSALVQAAKTERKLRQDIEGIAARLEGMRFQEDRLRSSLLERRDVLAEVLAALQRMGLNPPPAVLVQPEDALASVRSAVLLGAVVPEIRAQTAKLHADVQALAALKASIESERSRLFRTVADQAGEKHRLAGLIEEKRKLEQRSEAGLAEERARSEAMAGRAETLQELISSLESDIALAHEAAAEIQRRAEDEQARSPPAPTPSLLAGPPFDSLKKQVFLPAFGEIGQRFGQPDAAGRPLMGDMVKTQSGAIVTAPAAGEVLYAGPFRSYGQLLILNVGGGYHVVLAGMGRLSVALGQTLMAGEPVGAMGETRVASSAAFDNMNNGPELYVEFRKDGKPVDPSPWWAERSSGRTGNAT